MEGEDRPLGPGRGGAAPSIIRKTSTANAALNTMLIENIRELLAQPARAGSDGFLERVDSTLTAGYAHALQLEGLRSRLQRRLGDVAAHSSGDETDMRADEFANVSRRLQATNDELSGLRTMLQALRERRSTLRQTA
jgi:hypothetical protein